MGFIAGMVIVATVAFGLYRIIELFARRKERMAIIDKIQLLSNMELPDLDNLFSSKNSESFLSLRIALLMLGLGMGLLIAFFIDMHSLNIGHTNKDMLYAPCLLMFGGLALLASYIIERNSIKKDNK